MNKILSSITKKEKYLILFLSLFVVFVTFIPYIYGYLRTPDNYFYTGIHALTPVDTNVYYSYLEQVEQGDIIFKNLYTSEIQETPLIKPFWTGVGVFENMLGTSHWLTIQIVRSILIFVFVFIAYVFIAYVFKEKKHRGTAIILLLFSSGVGGILSPFLESLKYISEGYYNWPMDLWVPESVTFLSMFHIPHILFSSILSLITFLCLLISFDSNKYKYSIIAGFTAFVWFSFHPFHVFTLFVVFFVYIFIKAILNKKIPFNYVKHFSIVVVMSLPSVVYHFVIIAQDPMMAGRAAQNTLFTPVWGFLVVSYGLIGILAVLALFWVFKKKENKWLFIATWFVVQTLLLYSPITFQRRLSQNLHFPIVLLSVFAIIHLVNKYRETKVIKVLTTNKIVVIIIFVVLLSFSNVYAIINDFLLYKNITYPFFYLSNDHEKSFNWLKENMGEEDVILSEWIDGNFIPGYAGKTVYIGHSVETVKYKYKQEQIKWFFYNNTELDEKEQFLRDNNIDLIYTSDRSRTLGDFDPSNKKFLQEEFSAGEVSIYKVIE